MAAGSPVCIKCINAPVRLAYTLQPGASEQFIILAFVMLILMQADSGLRVVDTHLC